MEELEPIIYPIFRKKKENIIYYGSKSIVRIKNKSKKDVKVAFIGIFNEQQVSDLERIMKYIKDHHFFPFSNIEFETLDSNKKGKKYKIKPEYFSENSINKKFYVIFIDEKLNIYKTEVKVERNKRRKILFPVISFIWGNINLILLIIGTKTSNRPIISNISFVFPIISILILILFQKKYNKFTEFSTKILSYLIEVIMIAIILNIWSIRSIRSIHKNITLLNIYLVFIYILFIFMGVITMRLIENEVLIPELFDTYSLSSLFGTKHGVALRIKWVKAEISKQVDIDKVEYKDKIIDNFFKISSLLAKKESNFNLNKYKFLLTSKNKESYLSNLFRNLINKFFAYFGVFFILSIMVLSGIHVITSVDIQLGIITLKGSTIPFISLYVLSIGILVVGIILGMVWPILRNYWKNRRIIRQKEILLNIIESALEIQNAKKYDSLSNPVDGES